MKLRNIFVAVLGIGVLIGVWQFGPWHAAPAVKEPNGAKRPAVPPPETQAEREERWMREARTAFATAITNAVPGHKRTIRIEDKIVAGQPVTNWTANAVVEYVDEKGNFGRTTLFWKFTTDAAEVRIVPVPY